MVTPAKSVTKTVTKAEPKASGKVCQIPGCKKPVPAGRSKYCGPECLRVAQEQKLVEHGEKRKQQNAVKTKHCAIQTCKKEFKPTGPRSKYCCDECAAKGLMAAIERQRQRRQAAKTS